MKRCYVYMMCNKTRTLYTGMTNDLYRRVYEHRHNLVKGFTSRYNIAMLVHCEEHWDQSQALGREKQIKGWLRSKKLALVDSINSDWHNLAAHRPNE